LADIPVGGFGGRAFWGDDDGNDGAFVFIGKKFLGNGLIEKNGECEDSCAESEEGAGVTERGREALGVEKGDAM